MPAEFTCCECGRDVVDIVHDEPPPFGLCAFCLHQPGWFRVPMFRASLDPSHDGTEFGMEERDVG